MTATLEAPATYILSGDPALELAYKFSNEGQEQYDYLIVGEKQAKLMFIAGLAMGDGNLALIGLPGGGKSTLIENAHRIVNGILPENVAFVPHRADLTPGELVGESSQSVKTVINAKGISTKETIAAEMEALLHCNTQAAVFDEVTRANPHALNAALGVLAKRRLIVNGVVVPMTRLELVASALNPAETLTASFKPTAALGSRQTMGAILGGNTGAEREGIQNAIWDDDWFEQPWAVKPVINLNELHQIRDAIPFVTIDGDLRKKGKSVSMKTRDALADDEISDVKVEEADGRIADKLKRITRTLALLRGHVFADEDDLHNAVSFTVTGRLGFRGVDKPTISKVVDSIFA